MKHLEPTPKDRLQEHEKSASQSISSKLKLFIVAMTLVGGLGYGMTALWEPAGDRVSDEKKAELKVEFSQLKTVEVEPVAIQDIDAALASMNLPPDQLQSLKELFSPNNENAKVNYEDKTKLVWVSLWDFATVDGDVVEVSAAGYNRQVSLEKQEQRIAVPVDASNAIKITGIRDGGLGITVGVKSGGTLLSMPVMDIGQTLILRLSH